MIVQMNIEKLYISNVVKNIIKKLLHLQVYLPFICCDVHPSRTSSLFVSVFPKKGIESKICHELVKS